MTFMISPPSVFVLSIYTNLLPPFRYATNVVVRYLIKVTMHGVIADVVIITQSNGRGAGARVWRGGARPQHWRAAHDVHLDDIARGWDVCCLDEV
jgi:hypothetical protein